MNESPIDNIRKDAMESAIVELLRTVYDPELPVNLYDLGLIYGLDADPVTGKVVIRMTLTSPACPVAGELPAQVQAKANEVDGVTDATVELVWDPPWTPERMSQAARLELNMEPDSSFPARGPKFFDINPHG